MLNPNKQTNDTDKQNSVSRSNRRGNLADRYPKTAVAVAATAIIGAGVGGGVAAGNFIGDTSESHEANYSPEQQEHIRDAVEKIAHRYDACSITSITDTHTPPPDELNLTDPGNRSTVKLEFAVTHDADALVAEEEFFYENAVVWHPGALRADVTHPGSSDTFSVQSPSFERGEGYIFEDLKKPYDAANGLVETIPMEIYPSVPPEGSRMTFNIVNNVNSNVVDGPYFEQPATSKLDCSGIAIFKDGSWQLELPQ